MVLPLNLLKANCNHEILVELKTGETFNGTLVACDSWMNMNLENAIWTSRDGSQFKEMDVVHIRGYTVKFTRIEEGMLKQIIEERRSRIQQQQSGKDQSQQGPGPQGHLTQQSQQGLQRTQSEQGSQHVSLQSVQSDYIARASGDSASSVSGDRGTDSGRGHSGRGRGGKSGRGRGPIGRGK